MTSTIEPGDRIPSVPVKLIELSGTTDTTSDDVLGQGRVAFFAVPGAFTPTCHTNHLPGFLANASKIRAAGIDRIVCGAVNDHHVMKAWALATEALGTIDFLADGDAALARALGLTTERPGMGTRYARSAMIIDQGIVKNVFVEDKPGVTVTGAPAILLALQGVPA